jgi:DNA end-binding protein Ku
VPKSEIDELYLVRPYYIVPDGKVGQDAFAVIRETIRAMDKVAIARVVLTNHDIQDVKVTKDMLDLAKHIVESKSADFEPEKFEDRYENALVELLNQKRKGEPILRP